MVATRCALERAEFGVVSQNRTYFDELPGRSASVLMLARDGMSILECLRVPRIHLPESNGMAEIRGAGQFLSD